MLARRLGSFIQRRFEALEERRLLAAAPVGVDDLYTVQAGEMLVNEPGVLANDYDADGDQLSPMLVGAPLHGDVVLKPDGGFLYRPDRGFWGVDSFLYRARAIDGESAMTTVTITVQEPLSPVIWSAAQGGNGHAYGLVVAGSGWTAARDFAAATRYAGGQGHLATLGSAEEWNWLNGRFGYGNAYLGGYQDPTAPDYSEPAGGWRWVTGEPWEFTAWGNNEPNNEGGEDFLEVMASWNDIGARFPRSAFYIEFEGLKNSAADDLHQVAADAPRTFSLSELLRNDVLVNRTNARLSHVGGAAHGVVQQDVEGSVVYTPQAGFVGMDSFTYQVASDSGEANQATVWLKVGLNDFPLTANGESYFTQEDTALLSSRARAATVLLNDVDRDTTALTVEIVSSPLHGMLELFDDGSFQYTPAQDYFGRDKFVYRAVDGPAASAPVMVEIDIAFVNDPPIARDDRFEFLGAGPFVVSAEMGVLANDTDVDFPLTAELVTQPAHGALEFDADGAFRYTAAQGFKGIDRFTYRSFDLFSYTPVTTVVLAVGVVWGDVDGDGAIDLNDFGLLKANFGKQDAALDEGDLDGDADVDLADFGLLKANFGRTYAPLLAAKSYQEPADRLRAATAPEGYAFGWARWFWDQEERRANGQA